MHLADFTIFYAAEGGAVSAYPNATSSALARHGRMRRTIHSTNGDASDAPIASAGCAVTTTRPASMSIVRKERNAETFHQYGPQYPPARQPPGPQPP